MSDPAERCNDCGLPRREHHHDGAAYGICGQFSEVGHPPSSPGTATPLPCPFCGGKPHLGSRMDEDLSTHNIVEWKSVGCRECDVSFDIPDGYDYGTAIERWNRRAIGVAQAAIESATNAPPKIHYFRPADAQSSQEPVCWIVLAKETDNVRIWWRRKEMAEEWAKTHDAPLIPLYAHPRCADAVLPLYAVPPSPVAGEDRPYCDPMKQAEAFYLAMYGEDGARWNANENKDIWIKAARNYEHRRRDALAIPSTDREAGK